jgi:NAD(P)-dependent dehydrogenase (short-subunit alcohol dehydrogenase family)
VALITGGDSGIGRSVAVHFAREGADVAIAYLEEHADAQETKGLVEEESRRCLLLSGDVGRETFCREIVDATARHFGRLDLLVNNAGEQHVRSEFRQVSSEQMEKTFRTNFFAYFCTVQERADRCAEASLTAAGRGRRDARPGTGAAAHPSSSLSAVRRFRAVSLSEANVNGPKPPRGGEECGKAWTI